MTKSQRISAARGLNKLLNGLFELPAMARFPRIFWEMNFLAGSVEIHSELRVPDNNQGNQKYRLAVDVSAQLQQWSPGRDPLMSARSAFDIWNTMDERFPRRFPAVSHRK